VAGDLVFVSGQLPIDPESKAVVPGGIGAQTSQVLDNLQAQLESVDSGLADVVRVTVYLRTREDWSAMNEVYAQRFSRPYPTRTAVVVHEMGWDSLVEMDAIASRAGRSS